MSISLRLRIILIIAATVPLLVGGVWSLYTLHRTGALAIEQSELALTEAGETSILKAADATGACDAKEFVFHAKNRWKGGCAMSPAGQPGSLLALWLALVALALGRRHRRS